MPGTFEGETAFVLAVGILLVGVSLAIHACFMFLILKSQVWLKNRVLVAASGASLLLASGLNTAVLFAILASMGRKRSGFEEFFR